MVACPKDSIRMCACACFVWCVSVRACERVRVRVCGGCSETSINKMKMKIGYLGWKVTDGPTEFFKTTTTKHLHSKDHLVLIRASCSVLCLNVLFLCSLFLWMKMVN